MSKHGVLYYRSNQVDRTMSVGYELIYTHIKKTDTWSTTI